jgi:RNA polymerase, sigma 54 subunit, RpoN/SigL
MKPGLELRLGQSLAMTPQLQQSIRLLQLSTLELSLEIQQAVDTNPLLEIAETDDFGEGSDAYNETGEAGAAPEADFQEDPNAGTELEFVIMVIAVSCVKLLSAHNSTQHTSRKHKV